MLGGSVECDPRLVMFLPPLSAGACSPIPLLMSAPQGSSGPCSPPPPATPATRTPLKFGMERILAADLAPRKRSLHSVSPPGVSPVRHEETGEHLHGSGVPCSECVSSLLRCCSVSTAASPPPPLPPLAAPTPTYAFYPGALHHLQHPPHPAHFAAMFSTKPSNSSSNGPSAPSGGPSTGSSAASQPGGKRKRSWSRAVFSNLQRKGLEKRFQLQKYITKPDRRQLAATLGLTDAQVKVWFQNRRMKWRHSKEAKQQGGAGVAVQPADSRAPSGPALQEDEAARRAADSTQRGGATSEDSDIDVEVDS